MGDLERFRAGYRVWRDDEDGDEDNVIALVEALEAEVERLEARVAELEAEIKTLAAMVIEGDEQNESLAARALALASLLRDALPAVEWLVIQEDLSADAPSMDGSVAVRLRAALVAEGKRVVVHETYAGGELLDAHIEDEP